MSSRALRRAQKEKEEQDRLQALQDEEDSDGGVDIAASVRPKKSAFALLDEADDQDEDENDVPQSDHEASQHETDPEPAQPVTSSKSKKKKSKKKKAATTTTTADPATKDDSLDDIDRALQELAVKNDHDSATTISGTSTAFDDACRLLAIDRDMLHVQNEMKKLFGRAALESDDEDRPEQQLPQGMNRRQQRVIQQNGRHGKLHGAALQSLKRNVFVQGKEDWPQATGSGLGMEVVKKHDNGVVEYRYVHHKVYQEVQQEFDICVASMNPEALIALMHRHPAHISTLLQVSEILKSQRQHTESREILERALFALGRAVHSTFAKTLAEGKARLDFRRPENRELWLAGWRYMQNLSMRGTWRTVYDWAKLLLALSPEDDPYEMWLTLDQYALRSKQDLDFLNLSKNEFARAVHGDRPNIQVSQGLAEYRSGNKSKGQQTLYSAISKYPWFIARLMQELDMDAPPAVWGQQPRNDRETLYAAIYAVQAKDIWNTPEHSALLLETASAVPTGMQPAPEMDPEITLNEARYVLLADVSKLIELIPRHFTEQYTSASDPLPGESIISYTREAPTSAPRAGHNQDMIERVMGIIQGLTNPGVTAEQRQALMDRLMQQVPADMQGELNDLFASLPPPRPQNEEAGESD